MRAIEQGRPFTLGHTGPQAHAALTLLQHAVDAQVKDCETFTRQAAEFHLKPNLRRVPSVGLWFELRKHAGPWALVLAT